MKGDRCTETIEYAKNKVTVQFIVRCFDIFMPTLSRMNENQQQCYVQTRVDGEDFRYKLTIEGRLSLQNYSSYAKVLLLIRPSIVMLF